MAVKSKILIIGATGYIGKFISKASVALGHPTFLLVRAAASEDAKKKEFLDTIAASGATILTGSLEDHGSLVAAIKQVEIVISAVGGAQILDQVKIVEAIKEAGTVKRFLPSEFGNDPEKLKYPLPVLLAALGTKIAVRRAIEAAGIPHTYVSSNSFAGYFLANLVQPGQFTPPRDKVTIFGDGNTKAIFVDENDIATYTIKAADDPRTLNKTLYIRPSANILTVNELVAVWEKKINKQLEKTYVSEEALLKQIEETPFPGNVFQAIIHSIFVKGDQYGFDIGEGGAEATELFPDVAYTTVDAYLSRF